MPNHVRRMMTIAATLSLATFAAFAQFPQPDGGGLERGVLPARWLSQGNKCMEIPDWQIHEYNKDFYILRQSPCTDFEKPLIFLFFGKDKALLADTGSANGNLAPSLKIAMDRWLARNHRSSIPLIVTHTHSHEDHTWGDKAVQAMNDPAFPVTFVASDIEAQKKFYGIKNWPTDVVQYDLGGRILDIIPIPGHTHEDLAFYDRNTGVLLTGDTLYPGRIFVEHFAEFQESVARLAKWTEGKPIAHTLGDHIEQTTTPFLDYPEGTLFQPEEHELALPVGSLIELRDALLSMNGKPRRLAMRDFSIYPMEFGLITREERKRVEAYMKEQKDHMWDPQK